jgi:xanthine dehydrogenase accessory factor
VFSGAVEVEGVPGRCVPLDQLEAALAAGGHVPVAVDPSADALARLAPAVLVDARMAKANLGSYREQAGLVLALGPGFVAGKDVHAVVETQRGPDLGRVIWSGAAEPDTSVPSPVLGHGEARVLRAPAAGRFRGLCRIGAVVAAGTPVGEVAGEQVVARLAGLLRGLLADGVGVPAGTKVGDVDPRGRAVDPSRISDKARAVAAGTLEAVWLGLRPSRAGR